MGNAEEISPLLAKQRGEEVGVHGDSSKRSPVSEAPKAPAAPLGAGPRGDFGGWTADGLPLGHGSVLGEPVGRAQWDSGLFCCLGRNDGFCSSDLEVCLLGSFAPCVLYGSNVERLGSYPGNFAGHCMSYSCLYVLGRSFFGGNFLAPCFSYPSRSAIRHKFNLEGSFEAFSRSCGCCRGMVEDEVQREQCESACDFTTHFCCHSCSLCQEGRELRRRLPHPGFNARPALVMVPPVEQAMGRGAQKASSSPHRVGGC